MKNKFYWLTGAICLMSASAIASIYCTEKVPGWSWSIGAGVNSGRYYADHDIDLRCNRDLVTGIDHCKFIHVTTMSCNFSGNVWFVMDDDEHTHHLDCNKTKILHERISLGFPCLSCQTRIEIATWIWKGATPILGQPYPPNYNGQTPPNPKRYIISCSTPSVGGGSGPGGPN